MSDPKHLLLDAALPHVPFDGWSEATFEAAVADSGVEKTVARAVCPRGAVDLAVAYHQRGDQQMLDSLGDEDLSAMRFRDRIAHAVRLRLEAVGDKEAVRRGTTLFALPPYAPDGAKLVWGTADHIWEALGDTSDDFNWYSKRMTLSGVYSATVLFWLGDTSEGHAATWAFLDRRIDNVMQIEKLKAQVNKNPTLGKLMAGPNWLLGRIKAPVRFPKGDFPGSWTARRD
ncbi:COQ9 family protein [Sulfitobacter sp. M57]|uniref:COQ9 family protein n=1 Tax=unclassified Sulfitobacter TaxID=196795 RepID=UPI0023E1AE7D|nr:MULTISPECIES: COQ9 family protein [unclassified Sulfitobacter]MDF3416297.1 COQ9 family protein [Sulfitobacter sp. KE5]MDF3423776.1 COQ9 family protein [Sulfitobacter sp. KE43]MDF3434843.1 COQ9 family protein [Sulfitobacter sp. KE42]MDF3460482.1 COQ9 family protein [Sulfitobacter sp. S74]MDF3464380.1 COQ9 family protein [Sulfitobacter sp. Ks18]